MYSFGLKCSHTTVLHTPSVAIGTPNWRQWGSPDSFLVSAVVTWTSWSDSALEYSTTLFCSKSCGHASVLTDMQAEHSRLALNQVHRSVLDEKCFVAATCAYGEVIYLPAISCCTEVIPQLVQLSSVRIILFKADGLRMGTANFLSV